jgi:hypothetical protein
VLSQEKGIAFHWGIWYNGRREEQVSQTKAFWEQGEICEACAENLSQMTDHRQWNRQKTTFFG